MPECRICLEADEVANLITPCNCRGSSQWVHQECLNRWRNTNINSNSGRQCEICLFNYIINNDEPRETFIINMSDYKYPHIEFFMSLLITLIFGNIIFFADSNHEYKIISYLTLDHLDNEKQLKEDTWFLWTFYQSIASFLMNIVFLLGMDILSLIKVKNKKKYFKSMLLPKIAFISYVLNVVVIIYLSKYTNSSGVLSFWSPLFVSIHFTMNKLYISKHNMKLININNSLQLGSIRSFQLNPINESHQINMENYIHNNDEDSIEVMAEAIAEVD